MSNVSKIFVRLNHYDRVIVDTRVKPVLGGFAVIIMPDGRIVLNRVVSNMQGCSILGKPIEIRRSYEHGEPPYTIADVTDERNFYSNLKRFEQLLYRGLLKAERRRGFIDYQRITEYFFERLNRIRWDGKTRWWIAQEGVQC